MTDDDSPVEGPVDNPADLARLGPNPAEAAPGTVRGDLALSMPDNLVHGSDSPESAEREIGLWFAADELV